MPPVSTDRPRASDLRRAILDTTRHLMVRDGYASLSMRKIGRAMGYSATSIYLHFDSKDALFHALVDEGMDHLFEALSAVSPARPAGAWLRALCRAYVRFGLENREYYEIMFIQLPDRLDRYPPEKYRRARRSLGVIVGALEAGQRDGSVACQDPWKDAHMIWAALHGVVSLLIARRLDVSFEPEAFADRTLDHLVAGLEVRGDGASRPDDDEPLPVAPAASTDTRSESSTSRGS